MKIETQVAFIRQYLKTHKRGITSIEAFYKFSITRLSAIIYVLKKSGEDIYSVTETNPVTGTHYSRYRIVED